MFVWCPICKGNCTSYINCIFKLDNDDDDDNDEYKCLITEALKAYIQNNRCENK